MAARKRRESVTVRWDGLNWQAEKWLAGHDLPVDMKYVGTNHENAAEEALCDAFQIFGLPPLLLGEDGHDVRLETRALAWQATCARCGEVGAKQEFDGDAAAIAVRHAEIGGFER
jgi:hypothetical protein